MRYLQWASCPLLRSKPTAPGLALRNHQYRRQTTPAATLEIRGQDRPERRGMANLLVPARDRQLGSENGGASLVAIPTDLPDFATLDFFR